MQRLYLSQVNLSVHYGRPPLTPCLDSSTDLERQIRSYSGGILELKSPIKVRGTLRSPFSDTSLTSRNNESDSISVADSESGMGIGHWTVLPLHRTVLEFLRQPENMTVVITAQIASKHMWEPWGGRAFIRSKRVSDLAQASEYPRNPAHSLRYECRDGCGLSQLWDRTDGRGEAPLPLA